VPRETETTGSTPTSRTAAIPHRQRCRRIRKWHISRAVIMSQDGHHLSARSSRALYRKRNYKREDHSIPRLMRLYFADRRRSASKNASKSNRFFRGPCATFPSKFCENPSSGFCVIQSNKQTNTEENITFLAEVIMDERKSPPMLHAVRLNCLRLSAGEKERRPINFCRKSSNDRIAVEWESDRNRKML